MNIEVICNGCGRDVMFDTNTPDKPCPHCGKPTWIPIAPKLLLGAIKKAHSIRRQ